MGGRAGISAGRSPPGAHSVHPRVPCGQGHVRKESEMPSPTWIAPKVPHLGSHSSRAVRVASGDLVVLLVHPSRLAILCTCVSTAAQRRRQGHSSEQREGHKSPWLFSGPPQGHGVPCPCLSPKSNLTPQGVCTTHQCLTRCPRPGPLPSAPSWARPQAEPPAQPPKWECPHCSAAAEWRSPA